MPARRRAAQTTVEAALALPTLLLVLFVLLQSALYVHALHVARAAAQEGARAAASDGATLADGEQRARALLVAGLGRSGLSLSVDPGEDASSVQVRVHGSMGLLGVGPVRRMGLPLEAWGSATRESFRPSGGGG